MANNVLREIRELLGTVLGLESHLGAGTAARGGGWGTASDGERRDQRARLLAARRKLVARVDHLPAAGMEELRRLLADDRVTGMPYLAAQLEAGRAGSDQVAPPRRSPPRPVK